MSKGLYVSIVGLDALTNRVKTWPVAINQAIHEQVLVETQPLIGHMHALAGAVGGSATHAARGLRISSTTKGVSVVASGSATLHGAEFGANRPGPYITYATTSRAGRAYAVRRRTKGQFRPWLGRTGYWFWPTVRTDLKGINQRVGQILMKAVGNG